MFWRGDSRRDSIGGLLCRMVTNECAGRQVQINAYLHSRVPGFEYLLLRMLACLCYVSKLDHLCGGCELIKRWHLAPEYRCDNIV